MSKDRLRIGCAGLGPRGRGLLKNIPYIKDAVISAICDIDQGVINSCVEFLKNDINITELKIFTEFSKMLASDIDAVIIATDISLHARMSIEALKAGKHVLSEVPAITSIEDAAKLYNAVQESGKKFMMGENCCFWAFINTWRTMYLDGLIGRAWYAESEYLHNAVSLMRDKNGKPTWRSEINSIQYLTHNLGPLLYILDDYCTSVSGFAPEFNPISDYCTGTPNEIGMFKTAKGALIKIFTGFGIEREPACHNFCLFGSLGTLETTRDSKYITNAYMKCIPNTTEMVKIPVGISYPDIPEDLLIGHGGADYLMLKSFVKSIIDNTTPPIDINLAINMSIPGIYAHLSKEKGGIPLVIPHITEMCNIK